MSEEKTKYDRLKDMCDYLVDTIGDSEESSKLGMIVATALDVFSEYEQLLYKDLEPHTCFHCKKVITESDEHLVVEAGTANVFCSTICYGVYAKESY